MQVTGANGMEKVKQVLQAAVWVALVVASLDFVLNIAESSVLPAIPVRFVLAPMLTTFALGFVGVLALGLPVASLSALSRKLNASHPAIASGFLVLSVLLYPIVLGPESVLSGGALGFYMVAILVSSITIYMTRDPSRAGSRMHRIAGLLIESTSVAIGATALAVAIYQVVAGGPFSSSVPALLVWGVSGLVMATWVVTRVRVARGGRSVRPGLRVGLVLFLSVMIVSWVGTRNPRSVDRASASPDSISPVILITVDTMRADRLNCETVEGRDTRIPDRLCRDSIWFRSAFSSSSWTLPSVTSILTGTAPWIHGATGKSSVAVNELVTLAERFADRGYRTYAIVRNMFLGPEKNLLQGFDQYWHFRRNPNSLGQAVLDTGVPDLLLPDGSTDDFTDQALKLIGEPSNGPVFVWVHYLDPHIPYEPPERYLRRADNEVRELGGTFDRHVALRGGYYSPTARERSWIEQLYDLETEYVRDEIERLVAALQDRGLYDRSLIVLTSDHGEEFWEHGRFEHGHSLYDELLRVPLIVKPPLSRRSRGIDQAVSIDSVLGTMVELSGIGDPSGLIGPSLAPVIRDPSFANLERPLFVLSNLYYEPQMGVIFDRFKYWRYPETGEEMVFDLSLDPDERHPLRDPTHEAFGLGRGYLDTMLTTTDDVRSQLGLEPDNVQQPLSEAVKEELRALGYLE